MKYGQDIRREDLLLENSAHIESSRDRRRRRSGLVSLQKCSRYFPDVPYVEDSEIDSESYWNHAKDDPYVWYRNKSKRRWRHSDVKIPWHDIYMTCFFSNQCIFQIFRVVLRMYISEIKQKKNMMNDLMNYHVIGYLSIIQRWNLFLVILIDTAHIFWKSLLFFFIFVVSVAF